MGEAVSADGYTDTDGHTEGQIDEYPDGQTDRQIL